MAKLTKDELIAKINDKLADNSELAVELMEDITDSFESVDLSGYVEKILYDELLDKYKSRFLAPEEIKEEEKVEVMEEEPQEVVDVEVIFEEEKEDEE